MPYSSFAIRTAVVAERIGVRIVLTTFVTASANAGAMGVRIVVCVIMVFSGTLLSFLCLNRTIRAPSVSSFSEG